MTRKNLALLPLAVLAWATPAPALQEIPDGTPGELTLEEVSVALQDGAQITAERGVLHVALVRSEPETTTIALEFHRFRALDPEHSARPPIFMLNGGPGFRGLGDSLRRKGFYEDNLQRMTELADVVVVGQRGIGSSRPDTVCRAMERTALDVPTDEEAQAQAIVEACRTCREHWLELGLDLSGLNVIEAAADVIDVADALEYGRITITGGSFGSHWGMAVMRHYPERVARAMLSGIEGPDHTYDMPSYVLNSLKRIAAAAEESEELARFVPEGGLIRAFEKIVQQAAEEPIVVEVGNTKVVLDAPRMRELAYGVRGGTGSRGGARTWPGDVIALASGDFDMAAHSLIRRNFMPSLPTASFFMLDCGSGISTARRAELLADPAAAIVGPLGAFYETACPVWESDLGEDFRKGFTTDIPTVLVHGTWDTNTPFENALEMLPSFENGKLVVVEGGSHGALGEALRESAPFRDAILKFLATGDMEDVPTLVELPPLDWVVPGD